MKPNIRRIYLYLFSFVGLIIAVIGCVRMVDLALKISLVGSQKLTYPIQTQIGPDGKAISDTRTKEQLLEDERRQLEFQKEMDERQQKQDLTGALAMVIVGAPLYLYHWRLIQKEK